MIYFMNCEPRAYIEPTNKLLIAVIWIRFLMKKQMSFHLPYQ